MFLAPLLLFGLLAALIPIAIHLIRRERPPKVVFGSIRFLKNTPKKLIFFQHLQQWALLLLRALLISLLVFAYELGDEFTVMKRGAVSFNRRADGLDRQTLFDAVTV